MPACVCVYVCIHIYGFSEVIDFLEFFSFSAAFLGYTGRIGVKPSRLYFFSKHKCVCIIGENVYGFGVAPKTTATITTASNTREHVA